MVSSVLSGVGRCCCSHSFLQAFMRPSGHAGPLCIRLKIHALESLDALWGEHCIAQQHANWLTTLYCWTRLKHCTFFYYYFTFYYYLLVHKKSHKSALFWKILKVITEFLHKNVPLSLKALAVNLSHLSVSIYQKDEVSVVQSIVPPLALRITSSGQCKGLWDCFAVCAEGVLMFAHRSPTDCTTAGGQKSNFMVHSAHNALL